MILNHRVSVSQFSLFKNLTLIYILCQFCFNFFDQLSFFELNKSLFFPTEVLGIFTIGAISKGFFLGAGIAFLISLSFALFNIYLRTSLIISLVSYFIYFSQVIDLGYIIRKSNLIPFFLLLLILTPELKKAKLSALFSKNISDDMVAWPIYFARALVCLVYFSSGINKILFGADGWADGGTLQNILISHFLWTDIDLGLTLANSPLLCQLLQYLVQVWEISFPLILIFPKLIRFYLCFGILFHLGTHITMDINYLKYFFVGYISFISIDAWNVFIDFSRIVLCNRSHESK